MAKLHECGKAKLLALFRARSTAMVPAGRAPFAPKPSSLCWPLSLPAHNLPRPCRNGGYAMTEELGQGNGEKAGAAAQAGEAETASPALKKPTLGDISMGFLICLFGLALLIVAFAGLLHHGGEDPGSLNLWICGGLLLSSIGVIYLFLKIHSPPPFAAEERHEGLFDRALAPLMERLQSRRKRDIALEAALLIALCAFLFVQGVAEAHRPEFQPTTPRSQFALAVSLPAGEPESISGEAPAEQREGHEAVLLWETPVADSSEPSGHSGLLPMSLAAALILALGLTFPNIGDFSQDGWKGSIGKIAVSLLSFALFGIGAGERASAEQEVRDAGYIREALPPISHVSSDDIKIRILQPRNLPSQTSRDLQEILVQLLEELQGDHHINFGELDDADRRALRSEIIAVMRSIERRGGAPTENQWNRLTTSIEQGFEGATTETGEAIDRLARLIGESNMLTRDLNASLNALDAAERQTTCAILLAQLGTAERDNAVTIALVGEANRRERRDLLTRAWRGIIGENDARLEEIERSISQAHRESLQRYLQGPDNACASLSDAPAVSNPGPG
ncbi:AAA family ATPase [Parasphingopyxis marina]|uniref:Uncharacterized protein n=1 Tax=Parasphingopyxis marina TaxID=2761622 RepID=A0A842I014_9SPHN|nr:hypothetical protein [Parasphingopyxis marina]MBC2778796.1 hypothetical protein [Parasphingopyxis marina]